MRLLDPRFKYVPSHSTDIRKTFARVRRELARGERLRDGSRAEPLLPAQRRVQRRLDEESALPMLLERQAG